MKGIKNKGLKEVKSFKNRLYKSRGMQRISQEDFKKLLEQTDKLIETIYKIDEKEV